MLVHKINQTANFLKKQGIVSPEIGIVLGTGLGQMVTEINIIKSVNYNDIPNFPVSTVESHHGRLIYGTIEGRLVLAMQGRFHYYEGYNAHEIAFPIRVMKSLGIKNLLLSNAAGALNLNFKKGELMLLDDHINFLPDNPLRGKNSSSFGPRFPDMSQPYSPELNAQLFEIATKEEIVLHKGVYVAIPGPNLETRAEYRMFRQYADAIGMSTVPEVLVANQSGIPCAAISVLTDECDPDNLKPATLEEILKVAARAEKNLTRLFIELIKRMGNC